MKDFFTRNKAFIVIVTVSILLVVGGVFLFGNGNGSANPTAKVDSSHLISQNAYKTSGFVNGDYLPASQSATATLVEFGDYECPACGTYSPMVKQLLTDFSGKITYVFRNYPLPQHQNALLAAYVAEAAGLQGKYWEMHEKLYSSQNEWSGLSDPKSTFINYAQGLGLNVTKFTSDINSSTIKNIVQQDTDDGNAIGITETPTFYLNGAKIDLTGTLDQLKSLVQTASTK